MGTSSPEGGRIRRAGRKVGTGLIVTGVFAIGWGITDTIIKGSRDQMAQMHEVKSGDLIFSTLDPRLDEGTLARNMFGMIGGGELLIAGGVIFYRANRRTSTSQNPPAAVV